MRRAWAMVLLLTTLGVSTSCKSDTQKIEAAYTSWDATMENGETDAEKLAATKAFLERFPDTEHTREAAGAAVYLLGGKLDDDAGADAFLVGLAARVKSEETRTALTGMRLGTLAKLRKADDLRAAAAAFTTGRELKYGDHERVVDAAIECAEWNLALAHAEQALPLSTPDVYRVDTEKRKLSEQRIADGARRRKVGALAAKGWALANLGRLDEALPALREAHDADFLGYMGNSESPAGSYLGQALLLAGQRDAAVDVLAVETLYGGDVSALAALRTSFVAAHGSDDGFDAYLGETRVRLARTADDFTLPDYAGAPRTFSRLRNGEVALLSFWFPT